MPFSVDVFDGHVAELIGMLKPSRICDIGPGAGKYGKIARRVAAEKGFPLDLTAIEVDGSYVDEFHLNDLYDRIVVDDAVNLIKDPKIRFDMVIIGDCIEHMRKSDGIDLLNFLMYRTAHIVLVFPDNFLQDGTDDHPAEAHISTWNVEDFRGWKIFHTAFATVNLVLIRGFLPSKDEIAVLDNNTILIY